MLRYVNLSARPYVVVFVTFASLLLPRGAAAVLPIQSCGMVVAAGTTVTLTGNLGPCDDTGITRAVLVEGTGTLDLGGFQISCADSDGSFTLPAGVELAGSKAAVRNGSIVGCNYGVVVGGEGKHLVESLIISESDDDGILIETGSNKNRIVANSVHDNGNNGVQIEGDRNSVIDNDFANNDAGVEVDGTNNKLFVNSVDGGESCYEIDGDKNKLLDNTATGCQAGFLLGGRGSKVKGGTATASEIGFLIAGPTKLLKSIATGNTDTGILVQAADDDKVKVIKNTATGNTVLDMSDGAAGCGAHIWKRNDFGTANEPCIQ